MFKKITHTLIVLLLALMTIIFSVQCIRSVFYLGKNISHYYWFLAGGGAYYLIMCLILRKNLAFFQTWIHEFLHTVICIFTGRRIESFHATANDGGSVYSYGSPNIVLSLAPYTIPFFTFILLLLRLIIPMRFKWFTLLIGFSFFMHLHAFIVQIKPYQTDLIAHGLIKSYLYIFSFLPMNIGICLYSVDMNLWYGIRYFFSESWKMITNVCLTIF